MIESLRGLSWGRFLTSLPLLLVACSAGPPGPGLDVDRVLAHVDALAGSPRVHDTEAARAALAYIEAHVPGTERFAVGDVELPAIDVLGGHFRDAERIHTDDPDLLVRFGPPGPALLITGHYDTVPGAPGAADNAVAVGLLIELAGELRTHPPPYPVMLAFTADEERGLVGAEALAQRRDDIAFAIALDLVGGSGDLVLNGASTLIGTSEMRWLADAGDRAGVVIRAPLPHRVVSRWWPQAERADHGAFTRQGIRAFHLYNRGQDGEWIDLAYHSPHDTPSRLDRTSIAATGRLLRALVTKPPPPHTTDGFWLPLAANTVVPRAWLLGLEVLLVALALAGLVRCIGPLARGGLGLVAGTACTALAITLAAVLDRDPRWVLAPLRRELAAAAIIAGTLGLVTRAAQRFRPWVGSSRYLAAALALPLAIGIAALAVGAAELAWLWLVPAAALAFAPREGRRILAAALAATTLLPAVLVLLPMQVREAAWNGFLPPSPPLAVWVGVLCLPPLAAAAWLARRGSTPGPLGTLVLPVGCALAVISAVGVVGLSQPACNLAQFEHFGLRCDRGPTWP
ncbi:MAG: M20/M25/M40 family metallo-hydrolase [Deltaproteobacteria bacterium]|nr:M20/M25/M40 family metallo-hydrolase [Deltaproteobacteria bacterium]